MEILRVSTDNFHKKNPLSKSVHMSGSFTSLNANNPNPRENKSETYTTLIQMIKSDLIQIHDMITTNSSDIKMYKILSKSASLTKKLSEIEEQKQIQPWVDKISEDAKNLEKIAKIYGTNDKNILISKLYLEESLSELLLRKINDFFTLMKLKLYKDDIYQETLSSILSIKSFVDFAKNSAPSNGDLGEKIVKLNIEKEKLTQELNEANEKLKQFMGNIDKNSSNNNSKENTGVSNEEIEEKDSRIRQLENEVLSLKNKIEINEKKSLFPTEIKISGVKDFKKILEDYEKEIQKSRDEFTNATNEEIKNLKNRNDKLEEDFELVSKEKEKLESNFNKFRNKKIDQDSYEDALKEQCNEMKETFSQKIEDLNYELNEIKQEYRGTIYKMQEELKQANYLKGVFLNQLMNNLN